MAPAEYTSVLVVPDSLKMLRETFCVAQSRVHVVEDPRNGSHSDRLQRLIDAIDEQRPLGPDCKHGERHTDRCQCQDKP